MGAKGKESIKPIACCQSSGGAWLEIARKRNMPSFDKTEGDPLPRRGEEVPNYVIQKNRISLKRGKHR